MTQEAMAGPARAPGGAAWLVFELGGAEYAVPVDRVREIIGLLPITRVPRLPDSVRGVINLRGRVIAVLDLRLRFGLEATDHGQRTCIIVLEANDSELGVVVDRVVEVAAVPSESIEEPPRFGADIDATYLLGVARHRDRVRLLLDVDRAVSRAELAALPVAEPAS